MSIRLMMAEYLVMNAALGMACENRYLALLSLFFLLSA